MGFNSGFKGLKIHRQWGDKKKINKCHALTTSLTRQIGSPAPLGILAVKTKNITYTLYLKVWTVHHNSPQFIPIYIQPDATLHSLLYPETALNGTR